MKIINFIFLSLLAVGQLIYGSMAISQNFNNFNRSSITVDALTKQAYISPEMQWSVLSFDGKPNNFIVDRITGVAQDIPSVNFILETINQRLNPLAPQLTEIKKESIQKALRTILEATDLAFFVVSIKSAYQDLDFVAAKDQLIIDLNNQKQAVQKMLDTIIAKTISKKGVQLKSSSWWRGAKKLKSSETVTFKSNENIISIPASLMDVIVQNNDFRNISNVTESANLLFKQSFVAFQKYNRAQNIALNVESPISENNYIFNGLPNLYDKKSNNYPICQNAQNLGLQAHQSLLDIRQAVQIALYVANKKSNFNIGSLLSPSVISYLDGIVSELMLCDAHLDKLCTDAKFGATVQDVVSNKEWSTMSKIAAGIVTSAIIGGVLYTYGPDALNYAASKVSSAMNWIQGSKQQENKPLLAAVEKAIDKEIEKIEKLEEVKTILEEVQVPQQESPKAQKSLASLLYENAGKEIEYYKNLLSKELFTPAEKQSELDESAAYWRDYNDREREANKIKAIRNAREQEERNAREQEESANAIRLVNEREAADAERTARGLENKRLDDLRLANEREADKKQQAAKIASGIELHKQRTAEIQQKAKEKRVASSASPVASALWNPNGGPGNFAIETEAPIVSSIASNQDSLSNSGIGQISVASNVEQIPVAVSNLDLSSSTMQGGMNDSGILSSPSIGVTSTQAGLNSEPQTNLNDSGILGDQIESQPDNSNNLTSASGLSAVAVDNDDLSRRERLTRRDAFTSSPPTVLSNQTYPMRYQPNI
ncbi:MAG: hypothetical protein JO129_04555 [Candidatus Dependentiae bacterium]|nr:hypothetical protein [Candidatus Dependentiae bacterium]